MGGEPDLPREEGPQERAVAPRPPSTAREYAEAVLVAVLLALFAKAFVFEAFQIPSPSMEDNLLVGDHVVVNKFVYGAHRGPWSRLLPHADVSRGDVVVFKSPPDPAQDFVKRAVAIGGDMIVIRRKRLTVNGEERAERYVVHRDPAVYGSGADVPPELRPRDELGPYRVPDGTFFGMGDNRDNSRDSRFWGPVPVELVKGRALFVYWSYDPDPELRASSGRGAEVRRWLDTALHFFTRTRWRRTFRLVW